MGMRKPDTAIYQYVLRENNLVPGETLFIDDAMVNVEAARLTGIQAVHLHPGITLLDLEL
jgi:putative hydrolase of the HAD superfamily